MDHIARVQDRREAAARSSANRFLFCDTSAITTKVWSEHYFGRVSDCVGTLAASTPYSLCLLLYPDIEWVDDGLRDTPDKRLWFFERFRREVELCGHPYSIVRGSGDARTQCAIDAITRHFGLG
jgi:nicotinamide riboside kinase